MRILYLSCHSILEYDEVKLFHELGHEVFSPGAYVEPANPGDASLRPSIPGLIYDQKVKDLWNQICAAHPGEDGKNYLTRELVDCFDCIIVMHLPRWIQANWHVFHGKRVVWRTIGQSVANTENQLRQYRNAGLEIVRYSPRELRIPGYIGSDAIIRFYKDPDEYGPWTGHNNRVITFAQHMQQRDAACNFSLFERVTRSFPRHLFGPGNEGHPWSTGKVPFDQLKQEMRDNRCYFYTGTHPASYTLNFIEAWMSGIPVVAIGNKWGNAPYFANHHLYEIPDLIHHGFTGFCSDNEAELGNCVNLLIKDEKAAKQLSEYGRQAAIRYFGKESIKEKWQKFLDQRVV